MTRFYLVDKAKDVFSELDSIVKLFMITGHVLIVHQAKTEPNSQN